MNNAINQDMTQIFESDEEQPVLETNIEAEDSWSYETPRPWLSIDDAALMLGRSARGVERSIMGRWGNKLPEGWQSRRVRIDGVDEWRIIPPPGFRIKHSKKIDSTTKATLARGEQLQELDRENFREHYNDAEDEQDKKDLEHHRDQLKQQSSRETLEQTYAADHSEFLQGDKNVTSNAGTAEAQPGFSLERLFQSASQLAQKELASLGLNVKNQLLAESQTHASSLDVEHTIVIDRSDEVEKLLRELANVQKELSEERRQHMDDMRLINQMQNNMRLLEVNATQTAELKEDLKIAQKLITDHKKQYQQFLALPWWKRIFKSQP